MKILIAFIIICFSVPSYAEDLVVIGKLVYLDDAISNCGLLHVGSLAKYNDIQFVDGKYNGSILHVIHGCVELSREKYDKDSGTLQHFKVGDYHRLVLTKKNIYKIEVDLKQFSSKSNEIYFCKRVDLFIKSEK